LGVICGYYRVALGVVFPNKPFGATWNCFGVTFDVVPYFFPFEKHLHVILGHHSMLSLGNLGMPWACFQNNFK
jgi:hypothetical protein